MGTGRKTNYRGLGLAAAAAAMLLLAPPALAQVTPPDLPEIDLDGVLKGAKDSPERAEAEKWALVLGKALFWDEQVGSDGQACASCHFQAGADVRVKNGLSPGFTNVPPDTTFGGREDADTALGYHPGETKSHGDAGPNYEVVAEDFPFHHLRDEDEGADAVYGDDTFIPDDQAETRNVNSAIAITTNDRFSSAGSFDEKFVDSPPWRKQDRCKDLITDVFAIPHKWAKLGTRMVEPRHTPSMINAVYFDRQFWDGRAKSVFNGKGVQGEEEIVANPAARIVRWNGDDASTLEEFRGKNMSLASQSVGPPTSDFEMSCRDRTFEDVGEKMLSRLRRPLKFQDVHANDYVFGPSGPLGSVVHGSGRGLSVSYAKMIRNAFDESLWGANGYFKITSKGKLKYKKWHKTGYHKQMAQNFSLFFGVAVMLYERTLISFNSKFDRCDPATIDPDGRGGPLPAVTSCQNPSVANEDKFTDEEFAGFEAFRGFGRQNAGRCIICHGGDLFSDAAFAGSGQSPVETDSPGNPLLGRGQRDALRDRGFHNVGLRPTIEDLLVGENDDFGYPKSLSRQLVQGGGPGTGGLDINAILCPGGRGNHPDCDDNDVFQGDLADVGLMVDGALKTPGLRNVGLTPPYFHYGGYGTLEQVLHSYVRGGSVRTIVDSDTEDATAQEPLESEAPELADLKAAGCVGDNSGTGELGDDLGFLIDIDVLASRTCPADGHVDSNLGAIQPLNCDATCQENIVAYLLTLSDDDVRCDAKQFSHPSITVRNGHYPWDKDKDGRADDITFKLPAVGEGGYAVEGENAKFCIAKEAEGDLFAPGMQVRIGGPAAPPAGP